MDGNVFELWVKRLVERLRNKAVDAVREAGDIHFRTCMLFVGKATSVCSTDASPFPQYALPLRFIYFYC